MGIVPTPGSGSAGLMSFLTGKASMTINSYYVLCVLCDTQDINRCARKVMMAYHKFDSKTSKEPRQRSVAGDILRLGVLLVGMISERLLFTAYLRIMVS